MSYLSTAPAGGAGSGTVTQVNSGVGLTGGPITGVGTLDFATSLQPIATLVGNASKFLRVNAGETAVEYATLTASPAGLDTEVQFNDGGVMGANNNFIFDKVNGRVGIGGVSAPNRTLTVGSGSGSAVIGIYGGAASELAFADALTGSGTYAGSIKYDHSTNKFLFFTNSLERGSLDANGQFGILTNTPTHALTLGSTGTGIAVYNTADQTTNYERVRQSWSGNVFTIGTEQAGTGGFRGLTLASGNGVTQIKLSSNSSPAVDFTRSSTNDTTGPQYRLSHSGFTAASSVQTLLSLVPTINQSSTAGYTALLVNPTETTTGSGSKLLADLQVGGVSKFKVLNTGVTHTIMPDTSTAILSTVSNSPGGTTGLEFRYNSIGGGTNIARIMAVVGSGGGGDLSFDTAASGGGAYAAKMTLSRAGNLGVGTASPASKVHAYQDDAEVGGGGGITIEQDGTGDALLQFLLSGTKRWVAGIDNSDNDDFKFSPVADLSNGVVRITTAGKITANGGIGVRAGTTTSSATPTINTDTVDFYSLTAQAVDITSFTTNLIGTPTDGQKLWIAITGTAARAITWGASFEASTVALPTTTVTTARLDVGFVWNAVTSKWRCVASA